MAIEIERKFLVAGDGWRPLVARSWPIRQAYLSRGGRSSVRVRIAADRAMLTIKSAVAGMSRHEFEYALPVDDAAALFDLRDGGLIEKRRHLVPHGGLDWEVDVFAGRLEGLVIAEAELAREDHPLELPPWLGREVTGDARYYNSSLCGENAPLPAFV